MRSIRKSTLLSKDGYRIWNGFIYLLRVVKRNTLKISVLGDFFKNILTINQISNTIG